MYRHQRVEFIVTDLLFSIRNHDENVDVTGDRGYPIDPPLVYLLRVTH